MTADNGEQQDENVTGPARSYVVYRPATEAEQGVTTSFPNVTWLPVSLGFAPTAKAALALYPAGWRVELVETCPPADVLRVSAVAIASFLLQLVVLAQGAGAARGPAVDPRHIRAKGQ